MAKKWSIDTIKFPRNRSKNHAIIFAQNLGINETTDPKSSNSEEPPRQIVDEDVDEEEVINYTVDEEEKASIDSLIAMSIPPNIVPYGNDGPQFGRRRYN